MSPTLADAGDIVLVDKFSPRLRAFAIRRGDIVIADSTYKADYRVCKRVVALEGDTVTPNVLLSGPAWDGGGGVLIKKKAGVPVPPSAPVVIPRGYVWLEGDNAQDSTDSRLYGPVPTTLVRGRVIARIWPFSTFTFFDASRPRPLHNHSRLADLLGDADICADAERRVVHRETKAKAMAKAQAEAEELRATSARKLVDEEEARIKGRAKEVEAEALLDAALALVRDLIVGGGVGSGEATQNSKPFLASEPLKRYE